MEDVLVYLTYDTSVTKFYHRVAERQGAKMTGVAATRKLLTVYLVLKNTRPYLDP